MQQKEQTSFEVVSEQEIQNKILIDFFELLKKMSNQQSEKDLPIIEA